MFVINICAFFHLKVAKHKVGSVFCFLILIFIVDKVNVANQIVGKKYPANIS